MPSQNLKIAAIPLDIVAHDSEANLAAAIERLNNLDKDTDLAVLPEMFNTGFTPDIRQLESNAQPDDGALITELRSQARHGVSRYGVVSQPLTAAIITTAAS